MEKSTLLIPENLPLSLPVCVVLTQFDLRSLLVADLHPVDHRRSGAAHSQPGRPVLLLLSPVSPRPALPQHHGQMQVPGALPDLHGAVRQGPHLVPTGLRGNPSLRLTLYGALPRGQLQCQPRLLLQQQLQHAARGDFGPKDDPGEAPPDHPRRSSKGGGFLCQLHVDANSIHTDWDLVNRHGHLTSLQAGDSHADSKVFLKSTYLERRRWTRIPGTLLH